MERLIRPLSSWLVRGRARLLLVGVTGLGLAAAVALLRWLPVADWQGVLLLAALAAAAERYSADLFGHSRVSASAVAVIAAGASAGVAATAPVALAIAAAGWLFRGRPVSRLAFNSGALILGGAVAAGVYAGVTAAGTGEAVRVAGALAAGLSLWLVSATLVGAMVAASTVRPFGAVVREKYLWLAGHYLVIGLVGLGMAVAWEEMGYLGLAAFVAPTAAIGVALRQGTAKARPALARAAAATSEAAAYQDLLADVEFPLENLVALVDASSHGVQGASAEVGAKVAAVLAEDLGIERGTPTWHSVRLGALLRDIGNLYVDPALLRRPGAHTGEERRAVQEHVRFSARLLGSGAPEIHAGVEHHHERWDGQGYPAGLRGGAIPLAARIVAVADSFAAMLSPRPHRPALDFESAAAEVRRCAGSQFDPTVVRAFERSLEGLRALGLQPRRSAA